MGDLIISILGTAEFHIKRIAINQLIFPKEIWTRARNIIMIFITINWTDLLWSMPRIYKKKIMCSSVLLHWSYDSRINKIQWKKTFLFYFDQSKNTCLVKFTLQSMSKKKKVLMHTACNYITLFNTDIIAIVTWRIVHRNLFYYIFTFVLLYYSRKDFIFCVSSYVLVLNITLFE